MRPRVLVVDDEPLLRGSIAKALQSDGMIADSAAYAKEAISSFEKLRHDLVILDLKLPDESGLYVLRELRALSPSVPVILITAHGTIEAAVEAIRLGAFDFVRKPFELEELLTSARNAIRSVRLQRRLAYHDDRARRDHDAQAVPGVSAAMTKVWTEVDVIAAQPVPLVLITGESGTGKSLIARALHYRSERAAGPFVELNAAAIPDTLLEGELFGHEPGAFSDARETKVGLVEIADGGTLFLDEVGDLAPGPQAKLLSFLETFSFRRLGSTQTRSVDLRLVAATNQPLERLVEEQRLRADLYYRLTTMRLHVPALRQRREDIPLLAARFVEEYAKRFRKSFRAISPVAASALSGWPWPGNVRELRSVLQRVVLMSDGDVLDLEHLPSEILQSTLEVAPELQGSPDGKIPSLEAVEQRYIKAVYALCGENKVRAADLLGITRQTLARRLGEAE